MQIYLKMMGLQMLAECLMIGIVVLKSFFSSPKLGLHYLLPHASIEQQAKRLLRSLILAP
jgi:hypothetical protein